MFENVAGKTQNCDFIYLLPMVEQKQFIVLMKIISRHVYITTHVGDITSKKFTWPGKDVNKRLSPKLQVKQIFEVLMNRCIWMPFTKKGR